MVLLVEDHSTLAREIAAYLTSEGWRVHAVGDGREGLRLALEKPWSLILLDLSLPGIDGTEICRRLRQEGIDTPVLMITARGLRSQIVGGLDCGADDYLVKPFGLDELVARMRALTRRTGTAKAPVLALGEITLDTNTRSVERAGTPVRLAPREYDLFEYLARHRGVPTSRLELIEQVWGEPDGLLFSKTVDVHVAYLRRKLGPGVIVTVQGAGYMVPDE